MQKKIIYVVTRKFWPITSGHETILYNYAKGLHEDYGYDIYLFCFERSEAVGNAEIPSFIQDVCYVGIPSKVNAVENLVKHSLLGKNRWPLQSCLYYSEAVQQKLSAYYGVVQPDAIMVDMLRLAEYILPLQQTSMKKILSVEDNLVKRYTHQLQSGKKGSLLGYYEKNTSGVIAKLLNSDGLKRFILKMEIKRLKEFELKWLSIYDYFIYVSPLEADEFNRSFQSEKGIAVTMGADVEYYAQDVEKKKQKCALSFLGNMSYAPNAQSIEMIAKQIMPSLPEDVVLNVIGNCPEELRKKIESPRIKVMGFVDDTRVAVKSTEVFLAPIAFGSGVKTKIVEAMAMGMPIVTNSVGAEALNVTNGVELFICDTADEIVEKVVYLLNHNEVRENMGREAQRYAIEHHSWKEINKSFREMGL